MALTVTDSTITKTSISITFSDPVVSTSTDPRGGTNPANYTIFAANSVDFTQPTTIKDSGVSATSKLEASDTRVTFTFASSGVKNEFRAGDTVSIVIRNVETKNGDGLDSGFAMVAGVVEPVGRITRDVEDAISYPILTEEIGYRPSPVGIPTTGVGGAPGTAGANLGQVAAKAITDVLGWKTNADDPKGFVGALTQSFTLNDVEGHVEATWTPRTYAVQTDLGGGITGAQASLYMRAKDALDKSLPLLDGLYPLDPEADPEYVKALREMARSQMTEIIKELGVVGLPSILRIDTYFGILLGQNPAQLGSTPVQFDPDQIQGTLGTLRDTYGIQFEGNPFNNSVEDEQDITNFRVISDYMTSLMQSWIANRPFFVVDPTRQAFFGTQLVLISRQFNVIAETVNEVRFALDSVFIGPNERRTLLLEFADPNLLPSMFLEDVLEEVENFANNEGPRLLKDGGKISVTNNILPVVKSLKNLIDQAHEPKNIKDLPDGFKTARVRNSLDDLQDQLEALINLTEQVEQKVPLAEDKLTINRVIATDTFDQHNQPIGGVVSVIGNGFDSEAVVTIDSTVAFVSAPQDTQFYSPQRIDVSINDLNTWKSLQSGSHKITVVNPNGASVAVTLPNGLTPGPNGIVIELVSSGPAGKKVATGKPVQSSPRRRRVEWSISGQPVGSGPSTPAGGSGPGSSGSTPLAGSGSGSATMPGTATPGSPSAVNQQLASLQDKHVDLQQKLEKIQTSHNALEQTLNTLESRQKKMSEAQTTHEALLQEVKNLVARIVGPVESKERAEGKDKKTKV